MMKLHPKNPIPGEPISQPAKAAITTSEMLDLFGDVLLCIQSISSSQMTPNYLSNRRLLQNAYEKLNHLKGRL
jgi:hypothetical protein